MGNKKDKAVSSKELVKLIKAIPSPEFKSAILDEIEHKGVTTNQWDFLFEAVNRWIQNIKIRESDEDD